MQKLQRKLASLEIYRSIRDYLPEDSSERWSLDQYLTHFYSDRSRSPRVLDLGCGEGSSMQPFQTLDPGTEWHGVDIESSPEVDNRQSPIESARSFDGINLPYPDETFDLIYCHQALKHARHPDVLVANSLLINRQFVKRKDEALCERIIALRLGLARNPAADGQHLWGRQAGESVTSSGCRMRPSWT